ncbi:MAG TPA: hypothetical protein GX497_08555 [Bacillus bacterium]|nr:hypothetical protein [Bacillus sp. (in: firmicutes)]
MFTKKASVALMFFIISVLLFGCSSGSSEPTYIMLNASVKTDSLYLYIENKDDFVWDNAEIKINEDYKYKADFLAKGNSSLRLVDFTKKDGERFDPVTKKVMKVNIYVPKTEDRKDGFWIGEFK